MAQPFTLFLCDLFYGYPENISTITNGYSTSGKVFNGDPSDKWLALTTTPTFICGATGTRTISHVGLAGHNLKGADVGFYSGPTETGAWTLCHQQVIPTNEDLIIDLSANMTNAWVRIVAGAGAAANVEIGVISLLGPYGYEADGDLGTAGGVVELKNESSVGVPLPIGRGLVANESRNSTPYGIQQIIRTGQAVEQFNLAVDLLRGGQDYEWWKIARSYQEKENYRWTNPGWYKGVWLTTDEWSNTTPQAYYCLPAGPPQWSITRKGGRVTGTISLVTLPR